MTAVEAPPEIEQESAALADDPRPTIEPLYIDERTVFQRVLAIIGELPAIGKTQRNAQQNFMFRGHDDVMNALNPLLARHGVLIVPDVMERVTGERLTGSGKTMYEVNLHVRFTFYGAGGDWFQASGWGEGTDMGDKATSKAMTMAFKYVLAEVFALATAEVSDADAGTAEETTRGARPSSVTREERAKQEFDPARHVLDGAIIVKTEEDADALRLAVRDFNPDEDWNAVEEFVLMHLFGKPYAELDGKQKREYYTRLANAVVRVGDVAGPGDFPPPDLEVVEDAWAWAFNGVVVALSRTETPSDEQGDAETDIREEDAQKPGDA